jgi:hypothetical protein
VTELGKILLAASLTIIGGCLVFAFQRFFLDPLNEQNRTLGRITFAMHYYGREYNSPLDPTKANEETQKRYLAASDRLRELGSSLAETSQGIRLYRLWRVLRLTPDRSQIDEAIGLLTRMSNSMFAFSHGTQMEQIRQNWDDADSIIRILGLRKWGK